jgi:intracellular septation protein A
MKTLTLILTFLPLIVFSVLARFLPHGDIGVAGLLAAVMAIIAIATSHPVWPPKIINACSLVLFALIAVLGFTLGSHDDRWLANWGGAGMPLIIGLIILILVPVIPFTEQFARETTPQAYWSSPTFKKINRVLTAACPNCCSAWPCRP